jgi:hypothetical protein
VSGPEAALDVPARLSAEPIALSLFGHANSLFGSVGNSALRHWPIARRIRAEAPRRIRIFAKIPVTFPDRREFTMVRPVRQKCVVSHALRPFRQSPASWRKPRNSGPVRRALARRDRKSGIFDHFGALTGPQSPVAIFESPEFWHARCVEVVTFRLQGRCRIYAARGSRIGNHPVAHLEYRAGRFKGLR